MTTPHNQVPPFEQPDRAASEKASRPRRFRLRHLFWIAGLLILLVVVGTGLWSQSSDYRTLGRHTGPVAAVAFSPDGQTVYSSCRNEKGVKGAGKAWDVATGREQYAFPGGSGVTLSPDGRLVATIEGQGEPIDVWDTETSKKTATLAEPPADLWRIAFSPDSNFLATLGAPSGDAPGVLDLWEIAGGRKVRTLQVGADRFSGLAFTPDGRAVACRGADRDVRLWELDSGAVIAKVATKEQQAGERLAFRFDGRYLASEGGAKVLVWEVTTGELLATLRTEGYGPPFSLAFSPDGSLLAAGGRYPFVTYQGLGCLVTIWEVQSWRKRSAVNGPLNGDAVWCIAFSPDGSRLALGTYNGYVGLVETRR
jgi:WD40 repeat protein